MLDVSKAFDSVKRADLIKRLIELGINGNVLNNIIKIYSNT